MKRPIYYWERCGCNKANGGSGMCGCVIANTIVGYEEVADWNFTTGLIRCETCHICQKILPTSEDLYWHLRAHKEDLLK